MQRLGGTEDMVFLYLKRNKDSFFLFVKMRRWDSRGGYTGRCCVSKVLRQREGDADV